jgi:hypothetical protein
MSLGLDSLKKLTRVELAKLYLDSMRYERLLNELKDKSTELALITGNLQYVLKGDPRKLIELIFTLLNNYCNHTGLSFRSLLNSITQEVEKWEVTNSNTLTPKQ